MSQATIVTIVGTRPEIIRLSRVIPAMDAAFNHVLVHTGQNSDPNLSEIFFRELDLRKPDYFLDVDNSSLGAFLGDTLKKIEKVFVDLKPDGVLILGDTNSAISAVLAKRMQIPVYHMEAGNRSFDENVPEETNRRLVDHASDFKTGFVDGHVRRVWIRTEAVQDCEVGMLAEFERLLGHRAAVGVIGELHARRRLLEDEAQGGFVPVR